MKLLRFFPSVGQLGGCALALLGLNRAALAQTPTRILFVGDSFTHGKYAPVLNYNAAGMTDENYGLPAGDPRYESLASEPGPWGGIPGIFKQFADEAGLSYEVHLEAISKHSLQYQYANALPVIAQSKWHKVVLQDLSTYPLPTSRGGNRNAFYSGATSLEQAIHAANPQAQVYLYETWARADYTYPAGQPYAGLPIDSMTQDLHKGYYGQFLANGRYAGVAPVGDAWLRAIQAGVATPNPYNPNPAKLDLWSEADYYHPSKWGAYLSACVLFYRITGVDPRTLGSSEQAAAALGIAPAAAVALQQVAYQQLAATTLATAPATAGAAITLWPSPAHAQVQVAGLEPGQALGVYNALGQLVATGVAPATGPAQLVLPLQAAPGLYVVRGVGWSRPLVIN